MGEFNVDVVTSQDVSLIYVSCSPAFTVTIEAEWIWRNNRFWWQEDLIHSF